MPGVGRRRHAHRLTPLAAIGLALIVLMASGLHIRADERNEAIETGLWASIAATIATARPRRELLKELSRQRMMGNNVLADSGAPRR